MSYIMASYKFPPSPYYSHVSWNIKPLIRFPCKHIITEVSFTNRGLMKPRHALGDDLDIKCCYASIPSLMLLSVGDLSLQCTPRSTLSMSEWTLRHEQWAGRKNSRRWLLMFSRRVICIKRRHTGADLVSNTFYFFPAFGWIIFFFFACCGIWVFFFCPEAHKAGERDGEQASCLDAKLFWQASSDSWLYNRSSWLTGSIHKETTLPRGSFGFEHDAMDEYCPMDTREEWNDAH